MQKSVEDCYYFYYSTCSKGDACIFRHCEKALGTEAVCKNWLAKSCTNLECPFRHMLITKNRSTIQCYWETTPSGCQKSYCPFLHARDKPKVGIVAPISQPAMPQPIVQQTASQQNRVVLKEEDVVANGLGESGAKNATNTCVVAPVIVKMGTNEDEESDSDSNTTSKQKQAPQIQRRIVTDKPKVISLKKSEVEKTALKIGVKSLEEIRKEKALKSQAAEAQKLQTTPIETASSAKPATIQTKRSAVGEANRLEMRLLKFGKATSNATNNGVSTTITSATAIVAQSNLARLSSAAQMQKETSTVKTVGEIKKEKNIMNIITNTISENQVPPQATLQIQPTKATTTQIASVKTAAVSTSGSSLATKAGESLKIKTLEEIKAEKEMKKKLLQQQESDQKMEVPTIVEDKTSLDTSQDSMDVLIRSPQSETAASGRKLRFRKSTKESTQVSDVVTENKEIEIIKNKENSSLKNAVDTTSAVTITATSSAACSSVASKRKLNVKPTSVPVNGNGSVVKTEQKVVGAVAISEEITVVNKKAKTSENEPTVSSKYLRSDSEFEKKILEGSLSFDESMNIELEIKANDSKDADFSDFLSDSFVSSTYQNETAKNTVKSISTGTKSEIDKEMDELMKLCDDDDFL